MEVLRVLRKGELAQLRGRVGQREPDEPGSRQRLVGQTDGLIRDGIAFRIRLAEREKRVAIPGREDHARMAPQQLPSPLDRGPVPRHRVRRKLEASNLAPLFLGRFRVGCDLPEPATCPQQRGKGVVEVVRRIVHLDIRALEVGRPPDSQSKAPPCRQRTARHHLRIVRPAEPGRVHVADLPVGRTEGEVPRPVVAFVDGYPIFRTDCDGRTHATRSGWVCLRIQDRWAWEGGP